MSTATPNVSPISTRAANKALRMRLALDNFDKLPNAAGVDVQTAAAVLGVSPVTLWRWARAETNPLKPVKVNGSTRWRVGALRAAMAGK